METVSPTRIESDLRKLTQEIGVRLAGSPGESHAADYVAEQFRRAGAQVTVETFPVRERSVERQQLGVRIGDAWLPFGCSLFSSTPGTDGRTIEAPIVFFEAPTEYQRKDLSHLTGRAVVHLGCHIESREAYRRLMDAKPAFLMLVDVRYPGTVPLADGMFPSYTRSLGAVPTVNVAFLDAWRWKVEGASAARLSVVGGMRDSASQNVIADLPGEDPAGELLLLGGHHDTQADSVGADDNATGVVGLLELARVLAPTKRRRNIRLISFGAEEQLSVGSAEYVRRHRAALEQRATLMFNLDSYGSHLGWTTLVCNGPEELADYVTPWFERAGLYVKATSDIVPYADHFPFVAAGIQGIYLGRSNCVGGRFFHHRPDDDMTRVSVPLVASLLDVVASIIADLANVDTLPLSNCIPQNQSSQVQAFWEDLFGGWAGG